MGQLINDLLSLSQVTRAELNRRPVDLSALAADIGAELRAADPARRASLAIQPGLACEADANLLRIALDNLMRNAWKFTAGRGDAAIEVGAEGGIFFVRDNGAGFDMQYAGKLFQPFERLHGEEEFPGTGIGLAIVERIIARHGGRVWAEAAPGAGATFRFTLGT
jgi:signal transduction histidine kinase